MNAAAWLQADPFAQKIGAAARRVVDLDDLSGSAIAIPGGQSANLASPHYLDLLHIWLEGGLERLHLAPEAIPPDAPTQRFGSATQ